MYVGDRVRVEKLERPAEEDRSGFVGQSGALVQRLNVPWTPDLGALWRVRFLDGTEAIFADSELATLDREGAATQPDMTGLKETWGNAPRSVSMPFKRRFGANSRAAPAILALLVFTVAGTLLIIGGIAQHDAKIGIGGGALVAFGLLAAAVLA